MWPTAVSRACCLTCMRRRTAGARVIARNSSSVYATNDLACVYRSISSVRLTLGGRVRACACVSPLSRHVSVFTQLPAMCVTHPHPAPNYKIAPDLPPPAAALSPGRSGKSDLFCWASSPWFWKGLFSRRCASGLEKIAFFCTAPPAAHIISAEGYDVQIGPPFYETVRQAGFFFFFFYWAASSS